MDKMRGPRRDLEVVNGHLTLTWLSCWATSGGPAAVTSLLVTSLLHFLILIFGHHYFMFSFLLYYEATRFSISC